jgi:predicted dehydrogenase
MIMADNKIKVAFIGAGNMGSEHLKAFANIPSVSLAGIYSRTKSKAEALAQQYDMPHVCDSIAELYEKTKADIVVITVLELSVREICLEAFKYNWDCLVEKPAGYNVADAAIIKDEAEKLNRKVYVALNRRHFQSTRVVQNDLAENTGQRLIHVQDQEDIIAARIGGQPELVLENWMYANAIHMIDYFRIFGRGSIVSVDRMVKWDPANPGFVIAKILFSSGDIGVYEGIWNAPAPWALSVTTKEKRWEFGPIERASYQLYGTRKFVMADVHEWDTQFKPGLRAQAEEMIKAFKREPNTMTTIADAFESMLLAEKIYDAS